jgi:hypothetical protein
MLHARIDRFAIAALAVRVTATDHCLLSAPSWRWRGASAMPGR